LLPALLAREPELEAEHVPRGRLRSRLDDRAEHLRASCRDGDPRARRAGDGGGRRRSDGSSHGYAARPRGRPIVSTRREAVSRTQREPSRGPHARSTVAAKPL
jgi:hypothetical protein